MARKMKDSGIEWIGEIPEGWEVLAHKYIMHKEKSICEHYSGEDVISLTLNGVVKRDLENPSGKMPTTFDGYQFVDPNDLLLCLFDIDVTPRCVGLVKDYGVTSPAYSRFKIHSGFCNAYYNYLLRFIDDEKVFVHLSKNLRSSLTESYFGAIKTIVPPKAEQQRIADYLDNRTFEIDTLLSKARSSIEEYKKLKQAVITQAVTKGVRGEREMKDSGVEWIGETPAEWRISRIKYVSIFEPSCDFRKLTPETIITYSPMECIKNGTFERRTSLYGNLAHTLTPFQNGDIVMAKVTPCFENGNIAIMNDLQSGYGLGSSELFVFRPQNINTRYLFYWLQNKLFVHQACATMTGTGGLKRISPSFVKNCNIHYPPAAEQEEIADYLDAKCAEIDKLIAKKEQLVKELESYKKSLIYEVVTGKREV
jgi:type I restriction enzyme S subunit